MDMGDSLIQFRCAHKDTKKREEDKDFLIQKCPFPSYSRNFGSIGLFFRLFVIFFGFLLVFSKIIPILGGGKMNITNLITPKRGKKRPKRDEKPAPKQKRCLMKNKLIWMILSVLGLATACEELGETPDMYGTPYITFSVKGKVTNTTGNPIPGILVTLEHTDYPETETDANGEFVIDKWQTYIGNESPLLFTDVDGPENGGTFQEKKVHVEFVKDESAEDKETWLIGHYVAQEAVEVVLEEALPEAPEE